MDVIKILPPLIITEKEIDRFVNALDQTLAECQRFPGPMLELAKNYARTALRGSDANGGGRRVSKPATNGHNGHNGHHTNGNGNGHHANGNGNGHYTNGNGRKVQPAPALNGSR